MDFQKQDGKPLYQQIASWMTDNIHNGRWKSGHQLPPEQELAEQVDTSRGTLRKAIKKLVKQGLLEQRQGHGTFVKQQKISYPFAQELVSFAEAMDMKGYAYETDVITQKMMQPTDWVQNHLEIGLYDLVYYIKRIRRVDNEPALIIENWIAADRCPGINRDDFDRNGLFKSIESYATSSISYGVRKFAAKALTGEEADLLQLSEGDPALYLDQQTYDAEDIPLECSRIVLRSDQYEVTSVLYR
ncbi:DNA-binding GntR family transcriptional regulator [Alkalibacillus flavidus]|uniref:DNA-binding GntR family transcriptional regulator n=1 Tax=Alkalibacillus flavidus TaxID=546021 RepID=A0ABV2KWA9_9BACI